MLGPKWVTCPDLLQADMQHCGNESEPQNSTMPLNLVYEPLDADRQNIRLVKLSAGHHHSEPLVCKIETSPLLPGLDFQSLSYAWGQDKADVSLSIGCGSLLVTSNLANALRAVRRADRAILLWVDAICINQQDVEERNHQVQLMRQIYTTAATVNVWLGSEFAGTGEAFGALEQLAMGKPLGRILLEQANKPAAIESLTALFMYPWWQRLWVIQEALLANHALVFCGSHQINFQTILQAFEMLWNEYIHTGQQLRDLCGADSIESLIRQLVLTVRRFRIVRGLVFVHSPGRPRRFRSDPKAWPFLLRTCSWSNVSDPRDKVYGTLGLFPSAVLEPDYSQDIRATYTNSTFHIIERMGNLALVSQAVSKVSLDNGLPSWVPDWRFPSNVGAPFLSFYDHFGAGRSKALKIELLDERLLKVDAALVDEVTEVGVEYNHQGCTHAADLPSMLKPTMENWMKFLAVPDKTAATFTDQFTELRAHPSISSFRSPDVAIDFAEQHHCTQRSQTSYVPGDVQTSITQSLSEAPHQPSLSSRTDVGFQSIPQQKGGQKRRSTWNDLRIVQTGQSRPSR
ncbi:Ubiquitin-like protein [Vermiconidia calcicola]|uniref:Ubiquitin-like protein n=1 Tax=Vermiconidia calcicola TaxID=1690605 RepID=A0ACC3MV11_9PEZI|nr:Ubiquitin-like protein [Vermiconidia calcicola]